MTLVDLIGISLIHVHLIHVLLIQIALHQIALIRVALIRIASNSLKQVEVMWIALFLIAHNWTTCLNHVHLVSRCPVVLVRTSLTRNPSDLSPLPEPCRRNLWLIQPHHPQTSYELAPVAFDSSPCHYECSTGFPNNRSLPRTGSSCSA